MSARYYSYFLDEELCETAEVFDEVEDAILARNAYVSQWTVSENVWRIVVLDWEWKVIGKFLTPSEIEKEIEKKKKYFEYRDLTDPLWRAYRFLGTISKEEYDEAMKGFESPECGNWSEMPAEQFSILADPDLVSDSYVPKNGEKIYTLVNWDDEGDFIIVGRAFFDRLGTYAWKDLGYPDGTVIW